MDTIKGYLETMFAGLPHTSATVKAKEALLEMMEDKYQEMIEEGKAEHEAIAVVISEFGNIDELKQELGIDDHDTSGQNETSRIVTYDDACDYIALSHKCGLLTAIGVLLCIVSPTGAILTSAYGKLEILGGVALFVMIAAAVGCFMYSGMMMAPYRYLKKEQWQLDYYTTQRIMDLQTAHRSAYGMMLIAGVIMCILSVVPAILLDAFDNHLMENLSGALMLLFVGVGVFLIVYANTRTNAYKTLLKTRDDDEEHDVHYENNIVNGIMSVYWPTVTCLYLSISFLTFQWWRTWVIWVIAAIIEKLIQTIFGGTAS